MSKTKIRIFGIILMIIGLSMVAFALLNLPRAQATYTVCSGDWCKKPTPTPTPFYFTCSADQQCVRNAGSADSTCDSNKDCKPKHDCDGDTDGSNPNGDDKDCNISPTPTIMVTPTPTPSATPSAAPQPGGWSPSPQGNQSSTNPPGLCSDPQPSDVANFVVVNDTQGLKLEWAIVLGADNVDIRYGLQDGLWQYGALNIPNTGSYVVQGLNPHTSYFFQIAGTRGCSIGAWSYTVDPSWNP